MESSKQQSAKGMHKPGKGNHLQAIKPFSASDLPIDEQGRIYHLQVKPGEITTDILLVGDPGRAEFIGSNFLRDIEFEHEHRGFVTVTGKSEVTGKQATIISPRRTTVTTSGIGTSSLEIVVNELVALNEIDFNTRTRKDNFPRLHIIRVGTSGGLQEGTKLGTPIVTTYAIGMDSSGMYYEVPYPDEACARLEKELEEVLSKAMKTSSRFYGRLQPYVARAHPAMVASLTKAASELGVPIKTGLTVSAPGFFAPQGRDTNRVRPSIPELDQVFSEFDPGLDDQLVENMEMEASFLLHYLGGLGYWGGAICPAIANRRADTFDANYQEAVQNAINIALLALADLRQQDPGARTN